MSLRTQTTNGAATNTTSLSRCVDLFGQIGSSRGQDMSELFKRALNESEETAIRTLFWARDVRGGAGERETVRKLLKFLPAQALDLEKLYDTLVNVGRWDDLLVLFDQADHTQPVTDYIVKHINLGNGLLAKWMPRKGDVFNRIRRAMGVDPKTLRKKLVSLSNTVEQKMCARQWDQIDYSTVPSVASARYQKAFGRNDTERYTQYLAALEKGEAGVKINAGAIFPHDVVIAANRGNEVAAQAQWESLPDYLEGSTANILPMVDTSGSMSSYRAGGDPHSTASCMDVAFSLGMYLAERSRGAFRDQFITFESAPRFVTLSGNLKQRYDQLRRAPWGGSTDICSAFDALLKRAQSTGTDQADMPTHILILSDMQFNSCTRMPSRTVYEDIKQKYEAAGYQLPAVIFWNLNAKSGQSPVTIADNGTALVSGFSPSLIGPILTAEAVTPMSIMTTAIGSSRYDVPYVTNNHRGVSLVADAEMAPAK